MPRSLPGSRNEQELARAAQIGVGGPRSVFPSVASARSCTPAHSTPQDRAPYGRCVMKEPTKLDIICRAYELWVQAGCPEGKDTDFCRQAEQELRMEKSRSASEEKNALSP